MSYGFSSIGKIASADFETLEEAEKALDILRNAGGFQIRNRAHMTWWETLSDSSNISLNTDREYSAIVTCDRNCHGSFGRGKICYYSVVVVGNTIKDVDRAKSYIDKLS